MSNIFDTSASFTDLGLRESVVNGVHACGFEHPTDIQSRLIPLFLEGRDIIGQARTGTGKTAAFGLPLLHLADETTPGQALILVPTRELAIQVESELRRLGKTTPIRPVAIYGGQRIATQILALEKRPHIIVGTPGRVMDLYERGALPFSNIRFAILDEVDRMLDIGFRDDIRKILGYIPGKPQTVFVSATISPEIERLARRFMNDPVKIETSSGSLTVAEVDQTYLTVEAWDKRSLLFHLLTHEDADLTLVFCRTKITVDRVNAFLRKKGLESHAIHGDMPQGKRNAMMRKLRAGNLSVVVASDLAARGLDVSGISHVVNYDLPEDPEIYVHRIGRTARVGRRGIAWSFVTPSDGKLLTEIEKLANVEIPQKAYPDFQPGPIPKSIAAEQEADAARRKDSATALSPRSALPAVTDESGQVDTERFPGGIVPSQPPRRVLGGRRRTRRRR